MDMLSVSFLAITTVCAVLFYMISGRDSRVLVWSILWLTISGLLAYLGFLADVSTIPPKFLIVLIGGISMVVYFNKAFTPGVTQTKRLIEVHALRLPVELVLYQLYVQKLVPVYMTFEGWNFDILMGISAVILLMYMRATRREVNRRLLLTWNVCGLVFLTIIVVTALLSSPTPLQQLAFDQPNQAVLLFPYVFLPGYVVPVVYLSHIWLIRICLRKVS